MHVMESIMAITKWIKVILNPSQLLWVKVKTMKKALKEFTLYAAILISYAMIAIRYG